MTDRKAQANLLRSDRRSSSEAATPVVVVSAATSSSSSSSSSSGSSSSNSNSKPVSIRLPIGPGDQADQAAAACVAAFRENRRKGRPSRLLVTISLPLLNATDLDDWPGGIREQSKAARPIVERMLSEIRKQAGAEGGADIFREAPRPSLWDEGDAVVAYDSPRLACVVFPTPETLKRLEALAASKDQLGGNGGGLTIIVNPQWSLTRGSQLISDFGIGPWRQANEAKARSFEQAFSLKSVRIRGDEARVWYSRAAELDLKAGRTAAGGGGKSESESSDGGKEEEEAAAMKAKGPWNVFLVTAAGSMMSSSRLISSGACEPSYSELETLLKDRGNVATKGWLERAQSEAKFLRDSL